MPNYSIHQTEIESIPQIPTVCTTSAKLYLLLQTVNDSSRLVYHSCLVMMSYGVVITAGNNQCPGNSAHSSKPCLMKTMLNSF